MPRSLHIPSFRVQVRRRLRPRDVSWLSIVGAVLLLALIHGDAGATVFRWDGGGANTSFGTNGNWVGSAPSSSAENELEFGSVALQSPFQTTANNNVSNPFQLNSITFNQTANASFSITGSQFDFQFRNSIAPRIVQNSSLSQSIFTGIKLSEALILSGDGTGVVTLGGPMEFGFKSFSKTGTSSYVLTSAATLAVDPEVDPLIVDTGTFTLSGGTFGLRDGGSLNGGVIRLRGGVLSQSGTFNRPLGTGDANFNFGAGGGGFAAYNGALNVTTASGATWGSTTNFLQNGTPLIFGSAIADNVVTYTNGFSLGNGTSTREIMVQDNTGSGNDRAVIGGVITGTAGNTLNKTGAGTLSLTNTNTFSGPTQVSAGTLVAAGTSGSALGSTSSVTVNSGGTLLLGANDQINNAAGMTLAGGTFAKGDFSEGAIDAAGVSTLTLTASGSVVDFGMGAVGVLSFSSFDPTLYSLTIDHWTGSPNTIGSSSTDRLVFASTQMANLERFSFNGYSGATQFDLSNGFFEVVPIAPVPEPSTYTTCALALAAVAWHRRRRARRQSGR